MIVYFLKIDLLLESLFDCFSTTESYLLSFYKGLEYISRNLKELPEENHQGYRSPRMSNALVAAVLDKIHLNEPKSLYHLDFCGDILQNKHKIKGKALDYANKLFMILYEGEFKNIVPEKINLLEFFLGFLRNTYNENVIIKCCKTIGFWKSKWPSLWVNSEFDIQLEESI